MDATFSGCPPAIPGATVDAVIAGSGAAADAIRAAGPPATGTHLALGVDPLLELRVADAGGDDATAQSLAAGGAVLVAIGDTGAAVPAGATIRFGAHPHEPAGQGRVVHVGARGWGAAPAAGARVVEMSELGVRGLHACLDDAFRQVCEGCDSVALVVDLDAVDPAMAPGVADPEPGGLTGREILDAVRRCALELPVVSVAVSGVDVAADPAGRTALLANRIVLEALSGLCRRRQEEEQLT